VIADASLSSVTAVHEDAVTEVELVAGVKDGSAVFTGVTSKVFAAEGVGTHEAVVADVPVAGEVEVGGVVERGDADYFTVDRTRVVAPGGAFAPGFGLADASPSVFDAAVGFGVHASGDADRDEASFFGIAHVDVAEAIAATALVFTLESPEEFKIEKAHSFLAVIEADGALFFEKLTAETVNPASGLDETSENGAAGDAVEADVDGAAVTGKLGPGVDAR
jgi:hypothetical protein